MKSKKIGTWSSLFIAHNVIKMKNSPTETFKHGIAKPMLVAVVDRQVRQLSDMQLELIQQEAISIEDYNEISELIGNLKEYMINCRSYNGNLRSRALRSSP